MAVDKDIVAISIPFTIGVVATAAMPYGERTLFPLALTCSVGFIVCIAFSLRKGVSTLPIMTAFLCLGALSCCNAALAGFDPHPHIPLTHKALSTLIEIIDRCKFANGQTSALVKALLTGDRSGLPRETVAVFRSCGASHILALSGLHLGMIYGVLSRLTAILGRSPRAMTFKALAVTVACGFYTLMTGAGPSIMRAFLFVIIREWSNLAPGRKSSPTGCLCCALLVQLALNPMVVKSLSFQLSYLAMLGITLVFPKLRDWYPEEQGMKAMHLIWNSAALSLSCQLFTAPLVWLKFGTFPQYFLITNLIALPLTEVLIICSLPCLVLQALGFCPDILLTLCDILADTLLGCLKVIASL